jgi:purine-nucleoside phosphorylase
MNTQKNQNIKSFRNLGSNTVSFIKDKFDFMPDVAIVAGSGIADAIPQDDIAFSFDYSELPDFIEGTIAGHGNKLLLANLFGEKVLIFTGRFHIYEGRSLPEVALPALVAHHFGIKRLILTNAAGGLNPRFKTGDIMLVRDSINFTFRKIIGDLTANDGRHLNMFEDAWTMKIAGELIANAVDFCEGTYISVTGPSYETPAEITMFRRMGADAIGMSTLTEANAAFQLGMKTVCCSLISNTLKEVHSDNLTHEEVLAASQKAKPLITAFIKAAIQTIKA